MRSQLRFKVEKFIRKEVSWSKGNLKKLFFLAIAIFVLSTIISAFIFNNNPARAIKIINKIIEKEKNKERFYMPIDIKSFVLIMLINIRAAIFKIALSFIPFLFLPILLDIYFAFMIGITIIASKAMGYNIIDIIFLGLMPHGIIELLAISYTMSICIFITLERSKKVLKYENTCQFSFLLKKALINFALFVMPALIISSLIEAFITPILIGNSKVSPFY